MRQFDFAWIQRVRIDGEVVVVSGDLNLAVLQLLYRMISAVVSELELVGLSAESETNQLVSETNAEKRHATDKSTDIVLCVRYGFWISRSVRQKDSVRFHGQHIFCAGLCGNNRYVAARASQHPQNVVLDPVVICDDLVSRSIRCNDSSGLDGAVRPGILLLRSHDRREIRSVHLANGSSARNQLVRIFLG